MDDLSADDKSADDLFVDDDLCVDDLCSDDISLDDISVDGDPSENYLFVDDDISVDDLSLDDICVDDLSEVCTLRAKLNIPSTVLIVPDTYKYYRVITNKKNCVPGWVSCLSIEKVLHLTQKDGSPNFFFSWRFSACLSYRTSSFQVYCSVFHNWHRPHRSTPARAID